MLRTCLLSRANAFILLATITVAAAGAADDAAFGATQNFSATCRTPFGAFGEQLPLTQCKPLVDFVYKYKNNMTTPRLQFLKQSFIDYENRIVCCDVEFNAENAFDNVGAEVLRNEGYWCGDKVRKRISFGAESTFLSHPWSALLMYNSGSKFQCGGSLVTRRYVLTAAHCAQPHLYGVRLGEHNISSEIDCETDDLGKLHCMRPVLDVGIDKVIKHPKYSATSYDNDIALLRLDQQIHLFDTVKTICLPSYQFQDFNKQFGTICGWGATENSTFSVVNREAIVPIIEQSRCQAVYRRRVLDNRKLCTYSKEGQDTCDGDSGGPLYIGVEGNEYNNKFRYVQIGVISLGYLKCGAKLYTPAIYTSTAAYIDWIAYSIEL